MKSLCLLLLLFPSILSIGSSVEKNKRQKWVNLAVCRPTDFLIFDFAKNKITEVNGAIRSFKLKENSLNVNMDDSVLTLVFDRMVFLDDTLKIFFANKNVLSLLKIEKIQSSQFKSKLDVESIFLSKLIEATDSVKRKSYFLDFLSSEKMVITEIDRVKFDTVSSTCPWVIYSVDNVNVMFLRNIMCSHFFIKKSTDREITIFISTSSRMAQDIVKIRTDIPLKQNIKEQLFGDWEVVECSSVVRQKIETLQITQHQILVNESDFDEEKGRWYLDALGRAIVTDLHGDLDLMEFSNTNEKLLIESGGLKYVLKRKLTDETLIER